MATAGIVLPGLDGDDAPGPSGKPAADVTIPVESPPSDSTSDRTDPLGVIEGSEATAIVDVLAAIDGAEPLPYEEDGQTFQNREGLLPQQPLGYYREYTVETPGSADRGARRLVIGEAGETFYTNDHYASFVQIDPEEFQ